jgi:hypothetical protein
MYAKLKLKIEGLAFTSRFGYERGNTFDNRWIPIWSCKSEAQNTTVA